MDLYLFYNCINNITEVLETPEDRLTLKHQIMVNDPLVFSFYLKNLNKNPTTIYSGGAAVAAAAATKGGIPGSLPIPSGGPAPPGAKVAAAAANKGKNGKGSPQNQLAAMQVKEKKDKAASDKKKKDEDEKKADEDAEKQEDSDQAAEIEKAQQDSENASDTDGIKKMLKALARIIIGILMILIIPIVPFVMITFYSFKKLGSFFEINMNRL
jgi:hypothetical protein